MTYTNGNALNDVEKSMECLRKLLDDPSVQDPNLLRKYNSEFIQCHAEHIAILSEIWAGRRDKEYPTITRNFLASADALDQTHNNAVALANNLNITADVLGGMHRLIVALRNLSQRP